MARALTGIREGLQMSDPQWSALKDLLHRRRVRLMPFQVAQQTGLPEKVARALMLRLHLKKPGSLYLNVYHACGEVPVAVIPFGESFTDEECPECEEAVEPDELTYEIALHLDEPLEIE